VTTALTDDERRAIRAKARKATLDAIRALGGEAQRGAIREWALAYGGFTSRELAAPPPEPVAKQFGSLVEHKLSWALTDLKRARLLENPRWNTWRLANYTAPESATGSNHPVNAERLAELRSMAYDDYLRTPEWKQTRAAALLRAGNACSLDVTHTDGLEVHHNTYERLGEELDTDLMVLCRHCHRLHHREYGRPRRDHRSKRAARRHGDSRVPSATPNTRDRKTSLLRRLLSG
jgi:5-methylcytosine-specific restriction endonuclease McrA